ncbi:phage tail tape measure protein [Pseudanabaena sp. PCC 6802]|uniref:phage tail tape measure protein n=1 Tax=Pseudanabaena sp. PCC 6802 TaxID=118173 RepID=UPI00034A8BE3|nr:phage tail tape measure protein [Pseudanabaena sp. PCC 6802]
MAQDLQILITAKADQALKTFRQTSGALFELVANSKAFQESVGFADEQLKSFNAVLVETAALTVGYAKLPGIFLDIYEVVTTAATVFTNLNDSVNTVKQGLEEFGGITIPTFETIRKEAFGAFKEFDNARAKVGTLTNEADALASQMQRLAGETKNQYSSTILLNSSYDVLSAGFSKTADVSAILASSVKLAKAGFTDLGVASDAVTTILNAYGKDASEAAAIANELIQTQNLGKITVDQYGRSIGQVATIAAQAGVGLTELNAVISVATTKGLGASETITGLRQAISAILTPSSQAVEQAKALGIQFDSAALKSKGLAGVLRDIADKGGATPEVLNKLFGSVEAVSAILPATANNMADFQKAIVSLKTETGALDKAFNSVTGSVDNQLQSFQNRFRETFIGIGRDASEWVKTLLFAGKQVLGVFEILNPVQQVAAFQGLDGAIGGVINTIKELIATVVRLAAGVAGVFIAEKLIAGYDATFKVLNVTLDLTSARTAILTGLQTAQAVAVQALSAVMGLLTGTTTAYSLSLDLAAIKAGVLAGAQAALGAAMTFLNTILVYQIKSIGIFVTGIAETASIVAVIAQKMLTAVGSVKLFGEGLGIAGLIAKAFTATAAFLAKEVLPVLSNVLAAVVKHLKTFVPALLQSAATVAIFYGSFEAGRSIIDTFLQGLDQLVGIKIFDEFSKSLDAAIAATGVSVEKGRESFKLFGITIYENGSAVDLFNDSVDALAKGMNRAKNPIDQIATAFINWKNLAEGAADASDRFGDQIAKNTGKTAQITKAQAEAQAQQIKFSETFDALSISLNRGQAILGKYGLVTLEAGEAAKLGANGIAAFRKEAETQIASLNAQIESLRKVKTADAELQAQIDATIRLLEGQKATFQGRIVFLEEDAKKTAQAATAQKQATKTLEELTEAYKKNTDGITRRITEQSVLIKESQAKGATSAKEAQAELLRIEEEGFRDRIKLAELQIPVLRAKLVGETDKEKIKKVNDEILAVEKAGFDARKSLAESQIKQREEGEKKALAAVEEANNRAEAIVKITAANQIAAIKEQGLAREVEAKRITEIEKNASIARVQAIKDEIAAVQAAQAAGKLSPEEGQKKLISLNDELATANLQRIEKVRAAEDALRAQVVAGLEEQGRVAKLQGDARIAAQDKILTSLRSSAELLSAQSGLEEAQGNLAKSRLENQLKITEALGLQRESQQLKLQIQQQEAINEERVFAAKLKELDITQQLKVAELERQKIQDDIALKQERLNLLKLQQKPGVTAGELDLQKQVVSAAEEKLRLDDESIARTNQLNELQKQTVLTQQQQTRETRQTATAADVLKEVFGGINANANQTTTNIGAIAQSFGNVNAQIPILNTGLTNASVSASTLNDSLKSTPEVVRLTDGSIVSVNQKLGDSIRTVDDLNKKFGATSEVIKLSDGTITNLNAQLDKSSDFSEELNKELDLAAMLGKATGDNIATGFEKAVTAADLLNQAIAGMVENTKALLSQALAVKAAFANGATRFQGSATGLGGNIQTEAKAADGIIGSSPGQTVAQQQAVAASQGLTNEFEKAAFIFKARAEELSKAGLSSTEKINIGGAEFDYKEAAQLFGEAASTALNGQVAEFAKSVLGQRIAVAQTGQTVAGSTLEEILKNTEELKRQKLVGGFASGTRGKPIKSGIALVGERGPELINVTDRGTHVLSNPESAKFVGAFAQGTGGLKDFVQASLINTMSGLNEILSKEFGKGSGLSFNAANQISNAKLGVELIRNAVGEIAQELSQGNLETARALANKAQKSAEKGDQGIYRNLVVDAKTLLAGLFSSQIYQSDLGNLGRSAPNFRVQSPTSTNSSSSTTIQSLNISAPDPTGEAVRFLHENSRQQMRLARL